MNKAETVDHLDLMIDEFKRIKSLTKDSEIQGLCDRAITNTQQHYPVIVQRDLWQKKYEELKRRLMVESDRYDITSTALDHIIDEVDVLEPAKDKCNKTIAAVDAAKKATDNSTLRFGPADSYVPLSDRVTHLDTCVCDKCKPVLSHSDLVKSFMELKKSDIAAWANQCDINECIETRLKKLERQVRAK